MYRTALMSSLVVLSLVSMAQATPPNKPTNLSYATSEDRTLFLSWGDPTNWGNYAPIGFNIYVDGKKVATVDSSTHDYHYNVDMTGYHHAGVEAITGPPHTTGPKAHIKIHINPL